MSLANVVHRLIDVAAGTDRIGAHEVEGLHDEVDGIAPPQDPEPAAESAAPDPEELAAFRAWQIAQANQVAPAAITEAGPDA